jgi:hypothetical protein
LKFKDGVQGFGLQLEMRTVLKTADSIWREFGQELVVTETVGGTHSAGSLHYYGYAVDLRTNYFSDEEKKKVLGRMHTELPEGYDVILHSTHMHVEYDAIKSTLR